LSSIDNHYSLNKKLTDDLQLRGLSNSVLVGELFQDYNRPWKSIAQQHIANIWNTTNEFLERLLQYVVDKGLGDEGLQDKGLCDNILKYWLDPIMKEKLRVASSKLDELLAVHEDPPFTINHDFVDIRRKLQQKRSKKPSTDMDLVAAEAAFDDMNAYYQVGAKPFFKGDSWT
jgi:hypothetical protein